MEKWKWDLLTSSGSVVDKQLTNDITFIKTIILEHANTATYVKIYDESSGDKTKIVEDEYKEFMTIRNSTAKLTVPIILDVPAQLDNGCYIVPEDSQSDIKVWIQYREG